MADNSGWMKYVSKSLKVSQTHADFLAQGKTGKCKICKESFLMTNPMNTSLCKNPECIAENRRRVNRKAAAARRKRAKASQKRNS